jgi:hypothetical protein
MDMVKFRRLMKKKGSDGYNKTNPLHRWLAYLNESSPEEIVEEVLEMDAAIQCFETKMDEISRAPAKRRAYDNYAKALSDWTSSINSAKQEGIDIGEKRGEKREKKRYASEMLNLIDGGISMADLRQQLAASISAQ